MNNSIIPEWTLTENELPEFNKMPIILEQYLYGWNCHVLAFYVRPEQTTYIGYYIDDKFCVISEDGKVIKKYDANEVSCWMHLNASEIVNKEKIATYKDLFKSSKLGKIIIYNQRYNIIGIVDTIEEAEKNDKMECFSVMGKIPAFLKTYQNRQGRYKWVFVDDSDGVFTFNFYMSTWWGWQTIKILSTYSHKAGYEYVEKLLKLLNKEIK